MKEISPPPDRSTAQKGIFLYQKLLDCLAKEWDALITPQEEAILLLAAEKEQLLEKITGLNQVETVISPDIPEDAQLLCLKRQVAAAQTRNHRLITAALETIQDFLGYLQSGSPGIYQAAGKVETSSGSSFFHRQV